MKVEGSGVRRIGGETRCNIWLGIGLVCGLGARVYRTQKYISH